MEIPHIGLFLLPLGICLLFTPTRYLLGSAIFFAPFTATSLINSASGSALSAFNYLVTLLILRGIVKTLIVGKFKGLKIIRSLTLPFAALVVYVSCTIFIPIFFLETVYATVPDFSLNYPQHPIDFSFSKILRVLPFILGALFTLVIINQSHTSRDLFWSVRVYLSSLAIASLIAILQVIMSLYGIDYPYGIFNTMGDELMTAKGTVTSTGNFQLMKIHSVTQEGGHLAILLISGLAFLIGARSIQRSIFSMHVDTIIALLLILGTIFTTSTAGLTGLVMLYFYSILIFERAFRIKAIIIPILAITVAVLILQQLAPGWYSEYTTNVIFEKSASGSVIERVFLLQEAWEIFTLHPIMGVGWGNVTSHDFFVLVLANSGILGLVLFVSVIGLTLRSLFLLQRYHNPALPSDQRAILTGSAISLLTVLSIEVMSGFKWYLPTFWLVIGISIAAIHVGRRTKSTFGHTELPPSIS